MRVYLSDDKAVCDKEEREGADRGNSRTDRTVEDSNMLCIG